MSMVIDLMDLAVDNVLGRVTNVLLAGVRGVTPSILL